MSDRQERILNILRSGDQTAKELREVNTFSSGVTRRAFLAAQERGRSYVSGKENKVWVAMPGLRGIGKTTILSQLYNDSTFQGINKIFVSLDRVLTLGANIGELIAAFETFIGSSFEAYDKPIALFLDEVQYLENWAVGIKTLVDRSPNIFVFCTGSSALSLQTDANVARRIDMIKLHPLCFTEFVMIKQAHLKMLPTRPIRGLASAIRVALFNASSAEDSYNQLLALSSKVSSYWKGTGFQPNALFGEYLSYGTLPFTLDLLNRASIWDRINRILSESLDRDVTRLGKMDSQTIASIPKILFLLASSSDTNISNLCADLQINQRTLQSVLSSLEKTEIITAIPPKGSHNGNVRKSHKYMFTSPAMRAALCNFGGIITPERDAVLRGKLLEDIVAMYLKRLFLDAPLTRAIVEYDTSKGGADFIVSNDGSRTSSIALEVGANKTSARQAIQTLESVNGKYGLVVTSGTLALDSTKRVVTIPFEYFFLI